MKKKFFSKKKFQNFLLGLTPNELLRIRGGSEPEDGIDEEVPILPPPPSFPPQ